MHFLIKGSRLVKKQMNLLPQGGEKGIIVGLNKSRKYLRL